MDDFGEGAVVRVYEPDGFVGAQNEYRTIDVSGIKTVAGIVMTAFSQQITFRDSTSPSIEKVVAKGNTRLDVYFSEPLNVPNSQVTTLSNYQIGGRAISASSPTLNSDADKNTARVVTIKNVRTTLAAGTYVMGILGESFADYAGNRLGYQQAEFEIIADSDGPVAQAVLDPVYQYQVKIEFDEEITEDAYLRWVDGSRNQSSKTATVDGNVATFEFGGTNSSNKVIPMGGTTVTLVSAKDYSGNAAQAPLSFDVVPVADTLRPAVESYGSDEEGKIWIKFNKSISTTGASGWVIKNSDGDTVYDWSAIVNGDNNKQIDISESPAGGDLNGSGKYSITLKGVKDTVKPEANTILDTTIEVDVPDTGAPNINTATWRGAGRNIIDVNFDCEVDYGTAMTRGNYRTRLDNGNFSSLPNSAKLTMQPGNTTVSIEFATAFANGRVEISAQDVEDLAGNRSAAVKEVTVKDMSNSVSVKSTAANKIEVTFTTAITAYDRSNFTLVNKNATTEVFDIIDQASISDANKKVTLTLNKDLNADGTYGGKVIAIKYNLLDYAPNYENAEPQDVVDGIAPKVLTDSFYYNGGAGGYPTTGSNRDIYLVFNEKVYTRGTTANDDISESFTSLKFGDDVKINSNYPNGTGGTLEGPDGTQVPIGWVIKYAGTDTSGSNYVYKLTFDRTSKYKGGDVYTTYNATPGFELKDGSGNTLAGNAFSSPDSIYFAGVRFVD